MPPNSRILDLAGSFVISCGAVTIDLKHQKVLTVHKRGTKRHVLPKGRKNIGESLEDAAIREVYEESGYQCHLVSHGLPTRATTPSARTSHREPIAVQQRLVLVGEQKHRKLIFWYLGEGDSTAEWVPDTQDKGEDFETEWLPFDEAQAILFFDDDKEILEQALCAYRGEDHDAQGAIEQ